MSIPAYPWVPWLMIAMDLEHRERPLVIFATFPTQALCRHAVSLHVDTTKRYYLSWCASEPEARLKWPELFTPSVAAENREAGVEKAHGQTDSQRRHRSIPKE